MDTIQVIKRKNFLFKGFGFRYVKARTNENDLITGGSLYVCGKQVITVAISNTKLNLKEDKRKMSDKERLEEIRNSCLEGKHIVFGTSWVSMPKEDFDCLIKQAERVQELELEVNDWKDEVQKWQRFYEESEESHLETMALLRSTLNQNKRYRKALKFYADRNHYSDRLYDYKIVLLDDGETARKALEGEDNDK